MTIVARATTVPGLVAVTTKMSFRLFAKTADGMGLVKVSAVELSDILSSPNHAECSGNIKRLVMFVPEL